VLSHRDQTDEIDETDEIDQTNQINQTKLVIQQLNYVPKLSLRQAGITKEEWMEREL
jgi:hypothetical protein